MNNQIAAPAGVLVLLASDLSVLGAVDSPELTKVKSLSVDETMEINAPTCARSPRYAVLL